MTEILFISGLKLRGYDNPILWSKSHWQHIELNIP